MSETTQPLPVRPTAGMKAKNIKSVIKRKVDAWLATIEDSGIRSLLSQQVIVTGGAIASMLTGEPVNDFDVYFRTHDAALAAANYYLDKFKSRKRAGIDVDLSVTDIDGRVKIVAKSAGVASAVGTDKPYEYFEAGPDERGTEYVEDVLTNPGEIEDTLEETEKLAQDTKGKPKEKFRPVFLTSNAITLSDRIQIVIRFYGEPDEIHENYDFVHCTCYWSSLAGELVLRPAALEALLSRELRYVGSKYPVCSAVRLRKFIDRGWRVNAGQILKIAMQISKLDLEDIRVLEDQLTGVDAAYFLQLIERLKERDPDTVDSAYLVELVDRIFG